MADSKISALPSATALVGTELLAGVQSGDNVAVTPNQIVALVAQGQRELLSANRTYYVRTDGSDSNDGLANTSGGAWLTLQHAVDTVANRLDFGGYEVLISIADGTYDGFGFFGQIPNGILRVFGNQVDQTAVVINEVTPGYGTCFDLEFLGYIALGWFTLNVPAGYAALYTFGPGSKVSLEHYKVIGGDPGTRVIYVDGGSLVFTAGGIVIATTTTCASMFYAITNSLLYTGGSSHTISGTPDFAAFCVSDQVSTVNANDSVFSGPATGQRYIASLNGAINTGGGGANYFPGDVAGTTVTGGQYA